MNTPQGSRFGKRDVRRAFMVATPFATVVGVGAGLAAGAPSDRRAARVEAASDADAGTGLGVRIVVLSETGGALAPVAAEKIEARAFSFGSSGSWIGLTDEDGSAEAHFSLSPRGPIRLEVLAGSAVLASGSFELPQRNVVRPGTSWLRFARRGGSITLDAALFGERAPPGFSAQVWVRATGAGDRPLRGVALAADENAPVATTTASGWAEIPILPVGLAVPLRLHATASEGASGDWDGGLFMAPGGAHLDTRPRWGEQDHPEIAITAAVPHRTAYVEIDNARGRAWAENVPLSVDTTGAARGVARIPSLRPGLYWAVASPGAPRDGSMGPSATARPFFVAGSDAAALAFGVDAGLCSEPSGLVELGPCLALLAPFATPRGMVLDGFAQQAETRRARRSRGLFLAIACLLLGSGVEGVLVTAAVRAAQSQLARAWTNGGAGLVHSDPARVVLAVALLLALLGFALLAAFVLQG